MDAGRPMGTPVVLVAGAGGLACPSSLLCSVERLCLNSSCLFKRVLEGSVPEAWDDRDCLPLFVEEAESLAASQRPELWAPPEAAGERRPECPVPRASLSAAGLECSLHHLPSGTLPEPKIAQSRPRAPLWLPPPFTPAFWKDPSHPELGEAGGPGTCPLEGRRLTQSLFQEPWLSCPLHLLYVRTGPNPFYTLSHLILKTARQYRSYYSHLSFKSKGQATIVFETVWSGCLPPGEASDEDDKSQKR